MAVLIAAIRLLSRINRWNLELCRVAAIMLAATIAVVVAGGVFWRYVLNDALSWSEELAKFMMLWLVFVGAPIGLRFGDHVAIEMLPNLLPPRLRAAVFALVMAIVAVFVAALMVVSFSFAWNGRTQVAIAIGDISMFWIFAAIPFGAASMLLVALQIFLERLADIVRPGARPEDPFHARHHDLLRDLG